MSGNGSRRDLRVPVLLGTLAVTLAVLFYGFSADAKQAWSAVLVAGFFSLTLTMGAALLGAINVATGATWWAPVARVHLSLSRMMIAPVVFFGAVMIFGTGALYPWAQPDQVAHHHLLQEREVWLNPTFFLIRAAIILGAWFLLVRNLQYRVRRALDDPSPETRKGMAVSGVVFLVVFGLTVSVASWDWLMSLEVEHFSTMAAVYTFAGTFVGGIASVTLMVLLLQRRGRVEDSSDVRHDLGKLLFAFSFFWAYIWFCQYMLTWYANIPEEAGYFVNRTQGGWLPLFVINAVVCFAIPFVMLLGESAKRHAPTLAAAALIALIGRWLDTWMAIAPSTQPTASFPLYDLCATLAVLALMGLVYTLSTPRPEPAAAKPDGPAELFLKEPARSPHRERSA